jgi:hypothetical protein
MKAASGVRIATCAGVACDGSDIAPIQAQVGGVQIGDLDRRRSGGVHGGGKRNAAPTSTAAVQYTGSDFMSLSELRNRTSPVTATRRLRTKLDGPRRNDGNGPSPHRNVRRPGFTELPLRMRADMVPTVARAERRAGLVNGVSKRKETCTRARRDSISPYSTQRGEKVVAGGSPRREGRMRGAFSVVFSSRPLASVAPQRLSLDLPPALAHSARAFSRTCAVAHKRPFTRKRGEGRGCLFRGVPPKTTTAKPVGFAVANPALATRDARNSGVRLLRPN